MTTAGYRDQGPAPKSEPTPKLPPFSARKRCPRCGHGTVLTCPKNDEARADAPAMCWWQCGGCSQQWKTAPASTSRWSWISDVAIMLLCFAAGFGVAALVLR